MQAAVPRNGYLRAEEPEDHIVRIRTYDLLISYDKYYSVPKFWLVGYDESKQPLPTKQVYLLQAKSTQKIAHVPYFQLSALQLLIEPLAGLSGCKPHTSAN